MTLGKNIRNNRERLNITQSKLGGHVGVSQQMINFYESDLKKPSIDVLERLAIVFDCTVDTLLNRDKPESTA